MGVQGLMGQRQPAGSHLGQEDGGGALPQPVQRRVGLWCRGDRVTQWDEVGGDVGLVAGQQSGGTARQRAAGTAATFKQPILDAAATAAVPAGHRCAGTGSAAGGQRPGRVHQSAGAPTAVAGPRRASAAR